MLSLRSLFLTLFLFSGGSVLADVKADLMKVGAETYAACTACHGPDGKGIKIESLSMAPSLHDSEWIKATNPDILGLLVLKGIKKEDDNFVQQMLALEGGLSDEQLAGVLTYVRNTFGGHTDVVTLKRIGDLRKRYKSISPLVTRNFLGVMRDLSLLGGLADLKYKGFAGDFGKLPDFDKLEPVSSGELPNGRVDLDVLGDLRDKPYGAVFEGKLEIPRTADYELVISSDDGSRLILDGEVELTNDGIHPMTSKKKTFRMEEGIHSVRVDYFDRGGMEGLALAIRPMGALGYGALSRMRIETETGISAGKAKVPHKAIPLLPEREGEAVMYRNFIEGSQPRGIGVGYPGGLNLCWDADTYNVALFWRGDFMDASRHWTGRGQGAQRPMGTDIVKPAEGMALQVLPSPESTWENFSKAQIAYVRDTPDPGDNLITYNNPHPDYRFLGYELDERRFPTFRYSFAGANVEDFFQPTADGKGFQRTVRISGQSEADTFFRIGSKAQAGEGGAFLCGALTLHLEGAEPVLRNQDLLVPVRGGDQSFMVIYSW